MKCFPGTGIGKYAGDTSVEQSPLRKFCAEAFVLPAGNISNHVSVPENRHGKRVVGIVGPRNQINPLPDGEAVYETRAIVVAKACHKC